MIPEQLKHVRKKILGLSQQALADRLGMERKSISRMESGDQPIETSARNSFISFEPLGTILAIMPWNFDSLDQEQEC